MADPSLRNSMPASTRMNLRDLVASFLVTMWNAWKLLGVSIYDPCQDSGSRSFDLSSPFLASTLTGHEKPVQQLVPVFEVRAPVSASRLHKPRPHVYCHHPALSVIHSLPPIALNEGIQYRPDAQYGRPRSVTLLLFGNAERGESQLFPPDALPHHFLRRLNF